MKIFRSFGEAKNIRNPVITTGSFDGVHIGHKTILNRLSYLARKYNGESVLITFDPHPRKVLYPDTAGRELRLISSQEEKLALLEKTGLDNIIIIEFTREFSRITGEEFVRDILHGILRARVVVVGFNHHFGFNKEGDYRHLWDWQEKYHFEAEEIPEQEVEHETVSSTKIRKAISEGYIQRANAYLDHYYIVMGKPEPNVAREEVEQQFCFRVPVTEECKLLPSPGIYAVSVDSGKYMSKGMALVRPGGDRCQSLLLDAMEPEKVPERERVSLMFHKRIHGAINPADNRSLQRIRTAREEIIELIY